MNNEDRIEISIDTHGLSLVLYITEYDEVEGKRVLEI